MKLLGKIIYKTTIILIILGFLVNSFANFPFKKIQAQLGNLKSNEIVLNEEYEDGLEVIEEEIEEMRDTNSKVFKTNSGKYEYHYYDEIIHYYDEEKGFTEIDSSFEEQTSEYSSNSLEYSIKVPKKIHSNKKIKLSYENKKIEISYNDINKQKGTIISNDNNDISNLSRLNGKIIYENIFDNVDLELVTNSTSLKENIILNEYINNFSFSYNISLSNLILEFENNYLNFYDDEYNLIYQINPYFMIDSNNEISYDINLEILETKKNNYKITITPSDDYLKNAKYPVVIDPTINYGYNLIDDYVQIKNFVKGNITSKYQDYVSVTKYIDSVTKQDLSEVSIMKINISQLPKNVIFSSAELRMYSYSDACKDEKISLNNITSTNFDFENVKGTTSYSKSLISTQKEVNTNLYSFDILNAIKTDKDDVLYLEFSGQKFTNNNIQACFVGYNNVTYSPKLILKYYEASGLKDYWTYHSSSLGNAGTMYVNDFTGNLVIERVDYENPTERMSFNIAQYYNSSESDINIGYGNGWRFNYSDFIKNFTTIVGTYSHDYYTHIDGTGHKSYYKFNRQLNPNIQESGEYICEDGDDSIIEIGADYNDFYKRIVDGEYIYKYNTYGEVVFIAKNDNTMFSNAIYIGYIDLSNNQRAISLITDAIGNKAIFTYNDNNLLEEIEIKRKKIENETSIFETAYRIHYSYDTSNNLTSVKKTSKDKTKTQTEARYYYDDNKLSKMINYLSKGDGVNSEEIYFVYDSYNEKVERYGYSLYNSETNSTIDNFSYIDITYGANKTTFESSDGYKSYYTYDRYGHTMNVYDSDGYAKFYKYEFDNENSFLNNKLLEESESVYYKYNRITNHGFENYTSNGEIVGWNTSGNVTLNSTNRLFGEYSLKLSSTSSYASQTVQLYGNTTYKLSTFVKVKDMNNYINGGAYIDITANDSNGNIITTQTEYISPNQEFEEYIKEFTVGGYEYCPYQVTITLRTSINTDVYFDNIQFITGINDCRYNMLEDNSFENSYTSSNSKWIGGATYDCEPSEEFGLYNRYIPSNTILKQTLNVNISKGTILSFGGFINSYKSDSSIRLRFRNIETDTYSDYYIIKYSKDVNGYQYLMENVEVPLEGGCHEIEYEVVNSGETGIYADNLILMQDIFTNTYQYNPVGKPSKMKSYEKEVEIVRDGETNRKIQQIKINKNDNLTLVNYQESTIEKTVNIDGEINNITTTTYSYNEIVPNATVTGTFETKYFTTTTQYSYSNQFVSKETNEFNNSTSYEYDYLSGLLTKITDAKNIETSYEYDYYERLTKLIKDGNVIEYSYNSSGQIEKVKIGNENLYIEYYFEYNEYLDIKKIYCSSNTELGYNTIVEYEYYFKDNMYTGEIEKIINANGSYIKYIYDSNLKIIEVKRKLANETSEITITKYTYNESNNVSIYHDGRTNITYYYSYDLKGNLIQIIDSEQNRIIYTYDNNSNVTQIEYKIDGITNNLNYSYDKEGNINSVTSNGIKTYYEQSEDPLGRYFTKIVQNNLEQPILTYNYTYCVSTNTELSSDSDVNNLASNRIESQSIIVGNFKYKDIYSYDELGNIKEHIQEKINIETNQSTKKTHKYAYDNLNQLIKEEVYNDNTLVLSCNYTYDVLGNIISISRTTKLQEYVNLPSQINYYYEDTKDKTKLTKYVIDEIEFTMTYDSYNNLTKLNNYDITLLEGKITSLSYQNIDQVRYTYDATGRRIKKEIYNQNTQTYDVINYVYLNDVLIKEIHNDKTITYILDDTGVIGFKVTTQTSEQTYYYIKNMNQDIIKIVDENLNEVAKYEYDAYGNIVNINGVNQNQIAKLNPYRYRSYYYDVETNFYYLNARYYNPEIGRFITADDIEYLDTENMNGLNLYCYCLNNSIIYADYSGHFGGIFYGVLFRTAYEILKDVLKEIHYSRIEKEKEYQFPENYNLILEEDLLDNYITNVDSNCHQFSAQEYGDNIKIMSKDGHYEVIYNKKTGEKVLDPRDIGTYNYYNPETNGFMHAVVDVVPWVFWGNSEDDSTIVVERLFYMVYGEFV